MLLLKKKYPLLKKSIIDIRYIISIDFYLSMILSMIRFNSLSVAIHVIFFRLARTLIQRMRNFVKYHYYKLLAMHKFSN